MRRLPLARLALFLLACPVALAAPLPQPTVGPYGDASNQTVTAPGLGTPRTQGSLLLDNLNAATCGVVTDGVTPALAAINRCLAMMKAGSTLTFPPGGLNLAGTPSSPNGTMVYDLGGDVYGTSTQPITNLVPDSPTRSILGGFYFGKYNSKTAAPTVRVDATFASFVNSVAAVSGGVVDALQTNCSTATPTSATAYASNYAWCSQTVMYDSHIGPAQDVAASASLFRPANALADGFGPRGPSWAFYWEANDGTGQSSDVSGSLVGTEGDLFANGADPGTNGDRGDRIDLHMVLGRSVASGTAARIGHGISMGTSNYGTPQPDFVGVGLDMTQMTWDTAAIDTSQGSPLFEALVTTVDQGGAGTTLTFPPPLSGVDVGASVNGAGIAAATTVLSVTPATGKVVLSTPTTADVPASTSIAFTDSQAPAVRVGAGQLIDLSGNDALTIADVNGSMALQGTGTVGFSTVLSAFGLGAYVMKGTQDFCLDEYCTVTVSENNYTGFHINASGANILSASGAGVVVPGSITATGVTDNGLSTIPVPAPVGAAFSLDSTPALSIDTVEVTNANAAPWALALPACTAANAGVGHGFVKVDANTNPVVLTAAGTDTMSGNPTMTLNARYQTTTMRCDGRGLWIVGIK